MNFDIKNILEKIVLTISIILFLSISLIPFNYINVNILGIPFHYLFFTSLSLSILTTSWFLFKQQTVFAKWLLFLLVGLSINIFFSINRAVTIQAILSFILKGIGIAYVYEQLIVNKKEVIIKTILLCAFLVSLIGVVEYVGYIVFLDKALPIFNATISIGYEQFGNMLITDRPGIVSTLGHPNEVGAFIVLLLPIILWQSNKLIGIVTSIFMIIALIVTYSRGSWIAAVLSLIIYYILNNKEIVLSYWKVIVVLLCVVISAFAVSSRINNVTIKRVNIQAFKTEILHSHRTASYKTAFNVFMQNPFFGVGLGNYKNIQKELISDNAIKNAGTPDNTYLKLLAETGITGLSLFIVFMFFWFYKLWKNRADSLVLAIFTGLIGFMLNNLTCDLFFWPATSFTFWMLLGTAIGLINNKNQVKTT